MGELFLHLATWVVNFPSWNLFSHWLLVFPFNLSSLCFTGYSTYWKFVFWTSSSNFPHNRLRVEFQNHSCCHSLAYLQRLEIFVEPRDPPSWMPTSALSSEAGVFVAKSLQGLIPKVRWRIQAGAITRAFWRFMLRCICEIARQYFNNWTLERCWGSPFFESFTLR